MGHHTFPAVSRILGAVFCIGGAVALAQGTAEPEPLLQLRIGDIHLAHVQQADPQAEHARRGILQLDGPLTPRRREALRRLGVMLEDYLPQYAYVADLSGADRQVLAELDFVRHVGPFRREWKIDPALSAVAGNVFGGAARAPQGDVHAARRYQQRLSTERAALFDEGKVRVTISTFRRTNVDEAMDELSVIDGLELHGGTQVSDRAVVDAVVPLDCLEDLAGAALVQFVEDAPRGELRNATTTRVVQSGTNTETPVWDHGLHGEDQIIGLIDATPKLTHCMFEDTEPVGPTHRKIVAVRPNPPPAAHVHGTMVAGVLAGDNVPHGAHNGSDGIAFAARISYSDFFDVNSHPSRLLPRLIDAHNDGARVHSNSWGDDTTTAYTTWCHLIDQFSYDYEDNLVCFAVTNGSNLRTPENAKNVVAVGASQQYPNHNSHCYGGKGPTSDGRRKPETYAPGCNIRSASVYTTCGTRVDSGTSYACPAIAASAALVRQYYTEGFYPSGEPQPVDALIPSGALMRATLLNASVNMTGVSGYPSNREGWGRIVLDRALHFAGETRHLLVRDLRNADGLITGASAAFDVTVWGEAHDLRVTMVFTDPPAVVGSSNPVINDLDLLVTGPSTGIAGGSVYRGNYFKSGQSLAGGTPDPVNNVEQIALPAPAVGTYTIEVIGAEVNSLDPQGFAVVVSGQIIEGAFDPPAGYADGDGDGDMDLADFAAFQSCFRGDGQTYADEACAVFDIDGDEDIDLTDFGPFRQVLTGPQ